MTNHRIWPWWLFVTATVVVALAAGWLGMFETILAFDTTMMSIGILAYYIPATAFIAVSWHRGWSQDARSYAVEIPEKLGFLGTVVGMIIAFYGFFGKVDFADPTVVKQLASDVASGVSTALFTTAVGIVVSLCLETQTHILGERDDYSLPSWGQVGGAEFPDEFGNVGRVNVVPLMEKRYAPPAE